MYRYVWWLRATLASIHQQIGPIASTVLWIALAFQLYLSYQLESLLFYPLAVAVGKWSYAVYASVAKRMRTKKRHVSCGPILVTGLAFLASDAYVAYACLNAKVSTDVVIFGIAPFLQVAVILPTAFLFGYLLQVLYNKLVSHQPIG
jgi:hypothetical protein